MKKIALLFLVLFLFSCSKTTATPPALVGKALNSMVGKSLTGKTVTLPDDFRGKDTVLLVGYKQKAQFDIDRWILGILQAGIPVQIVEVPTIAGMMPEMVQGFISDGMRSGIPQGDWGSVVTLFEDAPKMIEAIGNERPQSAHVVLLNKKGEIVSVYDQGYSAGAVLELKSKVRGE